MPNPRLTGLWWLPVVAVALLYGTISTTIDVPLQWWFARKPPLPADAHNLRSEYPRNYSASDQLYDHTTTFQTDTTTSLYC